MKTKRAERELLGEAASLLDVLRDIREELRYLRQDVRDALRGSTLRGASDVGELLSVEQVAAESTAWWVDFAAYRTRRFPTP